MHLQLFHFVFQHFLYKISDLIDLDAVCFDVQKATQPYLQLHGVEEFMSLNEDQRLLFALMLQFVVLPIFSSMSHADLMKFHSDEELIAMIGMYSDRGEFVRSDVMKTIEVDGEVADLYVALCS